MTIKEKYSLVRPYLQNGDIIVVKRTGFAARCIAWGDSAYFTHVAVVWEIEDRFAVAGSQLQVLQSMTSGGVQPAFLSCLINESVDFAIIRSIDQSKVCEAMAKAFDLGDAGDPYNWGAIFNIVLNNKFGIKTGWGSPNKHICSQYARYVLQKQGVTCYDLQPNVTPQGLIRWIDYNECLLLFTDRTN